MTTKFIEIEGEVVKRIFNPKQKSKKGTEFSVAYMVLKWTTGANAEYADYVAVKTLEEKHFKDIRAGYKVKCTVKYNCMAIKDLETSTYTTTDGIRITRPKVFPDFTLFGKQGVEIIDSSVNLEQFDQTNGQFEKEVLTPPPAEDDLPF